MSSVNTRRALKQVQTKILNLTLSTIIGLSGLVAATPMFFSATAFAASAVYVRTDGDDLLCNGTADASVAATPTCAFKTIGAAITAVDPGGTINVAAGIYTEASQLVINKDLSIVGADKTTTIIKPAGNTGDANSGDARGWFLIGNPGSTTGTFNMSGVTLNGATKSICHGVYDYFAGTIQDINVKNIGCGGYYGRGIYLKNNATVRNVRFENIERIGVFIWQGASAAVVDGITYIGKGLGDHLDYGIELGNGGVATLINNTITGNTGVALSDGSTSAGILVTTYFGPGTTATITGNTLTGNTEGIAVGAAAGDTSTVQAHFNNLSGNTDFGIASKSTTSVDATCNWWGSATGPGPVGPGSGDNVTTNVNFSGWLTTDDLNGLCAGDTSSISGMKWNDANSDRQTLGESGIAGWTINLFSSSFVGDPLVRVIGAAPIASTTTDSDGNYSFSNLDPDLDYVVCEETQSNWNQTSPTLLSDGPVTCANDTVGHTAQNNGAGTPQTFTNMNFGNHNTPTAPLSGGSSSSSPVAATPQVNRQTYTVVSGDTLFGIGTAVGVDWHLIANINNISAPYTIYPGQVLQLPVGTVVVASQATTSSSEPASDFGDEASTAVKAISTLDPSNKADSGLSDAKTSVVEAAKNSGMKWYWWAVIVLLAGSLVGGYIYNAANRDVKSSSGR